MLTMCVVYNIIMCEKCFCTNRMKIRERFTTITMTMQATLNYTQASPRGFVNNTMWYERVCMCVGECKLCIHKKGLYHDSVIVSKISNKFSIAIHHIFNFQHLCSFASFTSLPTLPSRSLSLIHRPPHVWMLNIQYIHSYMLYNAADIMMRRILFEEKIEMEMRKRKKDQNLLGKIF